MNSHFKRVLLLRERGFRGALKSARVKVHDVCECVHGNEYIVVNVNCLCEVCYCLYLAVVNFAQGQKYFELCKLRCILYYTSIFCQYFLASYKYTQLYMERIPSQRKRLAFLELLRLLYQLLHKICAMYTKQVLNV